jgi:hypothetical protein
MPMMAVLSDPAEVRVGAMVTVPNTRAKASRAEIALRMIGFVIEYPLISNLYVRSQNLAITG